jgi:uncharacterized repeat protein (TIGR03803 family)
VLYGTTSFTWPNGCGTVFAIVPAGAQYVTKTLYAFHGGDGCAPRSAPIVEPDGAIYGATVEGGPGGFGTVFKLTPTSTGYTAAVLYAFAGGRDGYWPSGTLAVDSLGNVFGTTMAGGNHGCKGTGCGIAYELHRTNSGYEERVLHRFTAAEGSDWDGLTLGRSGALYGVTVVSSCGLLFEITAGHRQSYRVLHNFTSSEGCSPDGVIVNANGDVFGTTEFGGPISSRRCPGGCGTVFEFAAGSLTGKPLILHSFRGRDGEQPVRGVIASNGILYGTTAEGGSHCPKAYGGGGCGTVFEIRDVRVRWRDL